MKMPQVEASLWQLIARAGDLRDRFLWSAEDGIAFGHLAGRSILDTDLELLAGSAVLVATTRQLTAALAAIELDGVARRLVLCPPDLSAEHIAAIVAAADIDALVTDEASATVLTGCARTVRCNPKLAAAAQTRINRHRTEWVLVTSGTTGLPKLVVHTLSSLTAPIRPGRVISLGRPVWSTFYDIRRYGGLQVFLRAALGAGSLVLSSPSESTEDFLYRAGDRGVTHISGTPSHWRGALMSSAANRIAPNYVRLSGEIADQAILDDLRSCYPGAAIGHAFASTEAGVAFEVDDGLAGFPAALIGRSGAEVDMKIEADALHIRSGRTAICYLGDAIAPLRDRDGFVDTADIVHRRDERYYFAGRRDGVINVGGLKVHPEEVEAVINRHPAVRMSLVKHRKNRFTGAVVVADVVVRADRGWPADQTGVLQSEILEACRQSLPRHKVPATIRFVSSLNLGTAGKLALLGA